MKRSPCTLNLAGGLPLVLLWALVMPDASLAAETTAAPPYLLQMIRDDAIHNELGLRPEQRGAVLDAIAEVDPRWWVSRIQPAEKQQAEIQALTERLRSRLRPILDDQQTKRLQQLERQAHGTRMVLRSDVSSVLGIDPPQATQLQALFDRTTAEVARTRKRAGDKEIEPERASREVAEAQARERSEFRKLLTDDQQAALAPLVGKAFDFSKVTRTYPRAPEFNMNGAKWLSDQQPQIKSLRGKVVVVFFYAFQCINCKRNFPHYKAWHADMADQGLVVVGIQRPETSSERDAERVRAAASKDGFEFPVLFDGESANWHAWGNTMWPTTYLIDKDGFIRRWWQGEMNWNGIPGEQQMRESLEILLAEPKG